MFGDVCGSGKPRARGSDERGWRERALKAAEAAIVV